MSEIIFGIFVLIGIVGGVGALSDWYSRRKRPVTIRDDRVRNERRICADCTIKWTSMLALALVCLTFVARPAHCQTLRTDLPHVDEYGRSNYFVLLAWAGPTNGNARVYVWTTSSMSPNAIAPPPWDLIGENPYKTYRESDVIATQRVQDEATGEWRNEPMPGWLMIPVEKGEIFIPSENRWIEDIHMRVTVYLSDVPGCDVPVCGARTLLTRTDQSLILRSPGSVRRRAVAP